MLGMVLRISSGGRDGLLTMLVMVLRNSSGLGVSLEHMLIMVLRISSGGCGELFTKLYINRTTFHASHGAQKFLLEWGIIYYPC